MFLEGKPGFILIYDYGDPWTHRIRIGNAGPPRDDRHYPNLISVGGRCPLGEIGGVLGYEKFLLAFGNPDSEFRDYYPGICDGTETWDPGDAELDERRASPARFSQ
ncbi:MAG: hypothetical protein OXN84_14560 [Albidovulum sp.]|nr:hypothetical protein [Albidovulum sp.]